MNMYLFAREGKDRYIDFLKGISIISVVFLHNVPFAIYMYDRNTIIIDFNYFTKEYK